MEIQQFCLISLFIVVIINGILNIFHSLDIVIIPSWIFWIFLAIHLVFGAGFYYDNLVKRTLYKIFIKPQTIYISITVILYFILARSYPENNNVIATDILWVFAMIGWLCMDAVKFVYYQWTEFLFNIIIFAIPCYRVFIQAWTWNKSIIYNSLSDVSLKRTLSMFCISPMIV